MIRILPFFLGVALLTAACTGGATPSPERSVGPSAGALAAPDVSIALYQGQDHLGAEALQLWDLLGQGKPIVLNFWAGLCPPCRIEMPDFQELYEERAGEILVVGIDIGPFTGLGSNEEGRALLDELGVSYPTGTTSDPSVVQNYRILGMPSTYFITPDGQLHDSWAGLLTKDKLDELVDALIEASG